jgi:hypothetical protein
MKKILLILVFIWTALFVNAQAGTTDKVTFTLPGSLLTNPQRVKVPVNELPKLINDDVAGAHAGFTIKEAVWDWSTTLIPGNIFIYEVVITNGSADEVLLYDKDGKFIKKGVVKPGQAETKGDKPAQTPSKK